MPVYYRLTIGEDPALGPDRYHFTVKIAAVEGPHTTDIVLRSLMMDMFVSGTAVWQRIKYEMPITSTSDVAYADPYGPAKADLGALWDEKYRGHWVYLERISEEDYMMYSEYPMIPQVDFRKPNALGYTTRRMFKKAQKELAQV